MQKTLRFLLLWKIHYIRNATYPRYQLIQVPEDTIECYQHVIIVSFNKNHKKKYKEKSFSFLSVRIGISTYRILRK